MAAPSLTYSLTNGSTADASQVMQNFNDLLLGYTDGSKDLSISALTCAGTTTLNGHVNLGNSSADDLTVTASLASTLPIKTTNSYDIGSSTLGLRAAYFGANSQTVNIKGSASMSATWTLTLPVTAGLSGQIPQTDGNGVLTWVPGMTAVTTKSGNYTVLTTDGFSTLLVTAAADVTITLPSAASSTGRRLFIKKVDSGTGAVIVDGASSETIDGLTTVQVALQYDTIAIVCDGSNWHYIGEHYQSALVTATSTGHNPAQSNTVFKFIRCGRAISCSFDAISVGATVGSGFFTYTSAVPTNFRPAAAQNTTVQTDEGATAKIGSCQCSTAGTLQFGATSSGDTFNGVTSNGVASAVLHWFI